jgi:hypothetical protein
MPGPVPKDPALRRRRNKPASGEWQPTKTIGWQHGPVPEPPDGLLKASLAAWNTWFGAWFASHWTPADLPGIRAVVLLYDACERGDKTARAERRQGMDGYGITPYGQQRLHWAPPKAEEPEKVEASTENDAYRHLRAVK